MSQTRYELTDEHREQLKPWADKWIKTIMSTKSFENDKQEIRENINKLYEAANLDHPKNIVFVSSPFVGRFAAGFASWILKNRHNKNNATGDTTEDTTGDTTEDATRVATWDATRAAIRDATEAATWYATETATWDATWYATGSATRDATGDTTEDATGDTTFIKTEYLKSHDKWYVFNDDISWANEEMLKSAQHFDQHNGGNMWGQYVSFISFFRHVAKLEIDYTKWDCYERLSEISGYRYMHKDFCIVCDKPEVLLVDEQNRPHCSTGPFCRWRDGSSLYALNGVRVPAWLVETPESDLTMKQYNSIKNADIKAEFVRKFGIERMVDLGKIVDSYNKYNDEWYTKSEYELIDMSPIFQSLNYAPYLKMKNQTTGVWHMEGVSPECRTIEQAIEFRWGSRKGFKTINIK